MATWIAVNRPQQQVEASRAEPRRPTPPQEHDESQSPQGSPEPSSSRLDAVAQATCTLLNDLTADIEPAWHPNNWVIHEILNEREGDEETEFLTAWASSLVPKRHLHRHSSNSAYVMVGKLKCPVLHCLDEVGEDIEVEWEPTWNVESNFGTSGPGSNGVGPSGAEAIADFRAKQRSGRGGDDASLSDVQASVEDPGDDDEILAIRALPEAALPCANVDANLSAPRAGVCYTRLVLMYCKLKYPAEGISYASRACRRRLKRRIQFQKKWIRHGGALRLSCSTIRNAAMGFAVGKERTPCTYCENGNGPYPRCVTDRGIGDGACMNCMHTGGKALATCNHRKHKTGKGHRRRSQVTDQAGPSSTELPHHVLPDSDNASDLPSSPTAHPVQGKPVTVSNDSAGPSSSDSQIPAITTSSSSAYRFDINLYNLSESDNDSEIVNPSSVASAPPPPPPPPTNVARTHRTRRHGRDVHMADHWTCQPNSPCVSRYSGCSAPADVMVYSDQIFDESEATFEDVCYIVSRCYCDRADDLERLWRHFDQRRKNRRLRGEILDENHLHMDKETYLSTHHYDLLNETVAAVCPSRKAFSGEVIDLLSSDDEYVMVPRARRRASNQHDRDMQ